MKKEQLHELLYQFLETEQGGIAVYTTALRCAVNDDLKKQWQEYLDQRPPQLGVDECASRSGDGGGGYRVGGGVLTGRRRRG